MRLRSLKQQMRFVIEDHKAFGEKKRAQKFGAPDVAAKKIYSFSSSNNLTDFAITFSNFMQNAHPEVRRLVDVTSEHVLEFVTNGIQNGWSRSTVNARLALAAKMGILVQHEYGRGHDWTEGLCRLNKPPKMRDLAMSRSEIQQILDSSLFSKSEGLWGVRLAEAFGLRVSESVSLTPNDFKDGWLHVKGKGGKHRLIEIASAHQKETAHDFLKFARKKGVAPSERVLSCKDAAVNAFLRRALEKEGITTYRDAKTGIHAIRKAFAQQKYEEKCAAQKIAAHDGSGRWIFHSEAWDAVALELGHGRHRRDLFNAYIETR